MTSIIDVTKLVHVDKTDVIKAFLSEKTCFEFRRHTQ